MRKKKEHDKSDSSNTLVFQLTEDKKYQLKLKIAEGFIGAGNLALGSIVFAELFNQVQIKVIFLGIGACIVVFFYSLAVLLLVKGIENDSYSK